ncbi:hypothetical protein LTR37_013735 [Vermiconidia calcicola]|uniref:Uncharacterized protein n=1 Tax=Vermiconidia calcicola TaxID=1690605 RepID=A0ACC3MVJ6_9PEZI|nr:hypothetical protein LTR37_013735 [Vermiconidia calcicola]
MATTTLSLSGAQSAVPESPLLSKLAAEIRLMIYRYVLVSEGRIHIQKSILKRKHLLNVRQQLRAEASKLFYAENPFILNTAFGFAPNSSISNFLAFAGKENARAVSSLVLPFELTAPLWKAWCSACLQRREDEIERHVKVVSVLAAILKRQGVRLESIVVETPELHKDYYGRQQELNTALNFMSKKFLERYRSIE